MAMRDYSLPALASMLPHPAVDAYKYSRGKLTLVVGSAAYPGAACLAAVAGQKAGAGYTEVYVEDSIVGQVQSYRASLVVRSWSAWFASSEKHADSRYPRAFVVGCGFDVEDPYIASVTRQILKVAKAPVLVDGGALRLLPAKKIRDLCSRRYREGHPTVITPHRGEANTLAQVFGISCDDPEDLSYQLSRAYGAICLLKGPNTYVSNGDEVYCMAEGTSVLAKAGTGDALSGVVGALLAQGIGPLDSCMLGSYLHARAGNLAARDLSDIAVCPEDVIDYLPRAIMELQKSYGAGCASEESGQVDEGEVARAEDTRDAFDTAGS